MVKMTLFSCRFILVVTAVVLVPAAQGRRARHASWLTGTSGSSRCARCPPGWGVERRCGPRDPHDTLRDTACTPCREGESFSAHHSARSTCLLCSRCGPGLYAVKECTTTADTRCAACTTTTDGRASPPRRRNQDYHRRCSRTVESEDDDDVMMADAPQEEILKDAIRRHRSDILADDEVSVDASHRRGDHLHRHHGQSMLAHSTLLTATAARSKSDMARSMLADPGRERDPGQRLPHHLLADDTPVKEEYSLLHHQQARAGPMYSVLTDDGPIAPAGLETPPSRLVSPRPPPPRYPIRLSSPITWGPWGRPSAPSVNTQLTTPRSKLVLSPGPTTDLPLPTLRRDPGGTEDGDMNAEEVGRLMM